MFDDGFMTDRKMILASLLSDGYGTLPEAWRAPHVDPGNYADIESSIRHAQAAERGGFAFVFTPDFPAVRGDVEHSPISNVMDPLMVSAAISQATTNIGFVLTGSTTFQEPFNTARQFKVLDIMSHGRAGWNAVTTSDPAVAAAAEDAGRDPDDIKYFAGLMTTVAPTVREGLDRRIALSGGVIEARLPHLNAMIGVPIQPQDIDTPLSPEQLEIARASPRDPRSGIALKVAREGWSPRDILAHGVIDFHPTTVGPGEVHADHMQEWFEAEAVDGFWISADVAEDGIDAFVDEVVPILRDRELYPDDYTGTTLRENLGVPEQYGLGEWLK